MSLRKKGKKSFKEERHKDCVQKDCAHAHKCTAISYILIYFVIHCFKQEILYPAKVLKLLAFLHE